VSVILIAATCRARIPGNEPPWLLERRTCREGNSKRHLIRPAGLLIRAILSDREPHRQLATCTQAIHLQYISLVNAISRSRTGIVPHFDRVAIFCKFLQFACIHCMLITFVNDWCCVPNSQAEDPTRTRFCPRTSSSARLGTAHRSNAAVWSDSHIWHVATDASRNAVRAPLFERAKTGAKQRWRVDHGPDEELELVG
jgi:hypothetical protein